MKAGGLKHQVQIHWGFAHQDTHQRIELDMLTSSIHTALCIPAQDKHFVSHTGSLKMELFWFFKSARFRFSVRFRKKKQYL